MNCNNCKNNNTLKEIKIKHVYGNVLRLAIPLTLRTIELVDGEINATDTPFVPSSEHPVKVVFSKKGSVSVALDATMKDGNIAYIEEKGKIPVGTYAITVTCNDDNGNPYRFKQSTILKVVDTTAEAGIVTPIEYEVTTWYLNAAVFLALKGENGDDGVGIADITTETSSDVGGLNTITITLTDGRTRSFTILNGSGSVDTEFDVSSQHPVSNQALTERFNALDQSIETLFGDVDYDTTNKVIRFFDKSKAVVLATLDARPFVRDGMVSNVYISNNTLVITFNTDSGKANIGVPLTGIFNPNNYYNKVSVDNLLANKASTASVTALSERLTPVQVTFTRNTSGSTTTYTSDYTLAQINTNYSNHKPIVASLGSDVGVLLHSDTDYAVFEFADQYGEKYLLWCNHGTWNRIDGGGDIEIDDNPEENSENAVSSGGVYAALSGKVTGIKVNSGTTQWPDDGIVDLTIEGGGYEPPVGGIPKTDLASGVQSSLDAADSAYQKPSGGIPSTDMTSAVQTSLGKADTAYQKPSGGIPASDLASGVIPDVSGFVTSSDVQTAIAGLVDSAPETLDTLNELAAALGDDKDFATTMSTALGNKVDKVSGMGLSTNDYTDAEKTKLGGIAEGAEANVQADWEQTTTTADDYIKNKPTIPTKVSDLNNDSGFLNKVFYKGSCSTSASAMPKVCTVETFPTTTSGNVTHAKDYTIIAVTFSVSDTNTENAPTLNVNTIGAKGIYYTNALVTSTAKNTTVAGTKNNTHYYYYDSSLDSGNGAWVYMFKAPDLNTTYSAMTQAEVDAGTSTTGRIISPKMLRDNFYTEGEVDTFLGAKASTSSLATVATSGDYDDLTNKPTIPAAQVQSDWNASSGMGEILNKPTLATVATSGSYADLSNKPTIPTKVSDLTNDSGFTTNTGTLTGVTFNGTAATVSSGVAAITATIPTVGSIAENSTDAAQSGAVYTALAGKQATLVKGTNLDATPTNGSDNPVTSDGVYDALAGKQDTISNLATITTNAGKGLANVSSQGDGTVVITLANGDTYTINLNHTHSAYAAKKTVESNTNATVTLSADVIYDLGTVSGNKTINLPTTVDQAADYEFRLAYTSGTISGTAISGTAVANDATLTFTAGKIYQVIVSGGILYYSKTTVS